MTAAVVTVTTNRAELEDCVKSIQLQTFPVQHYILVDAVVPYINYRQMFDKYANERTHLCYWDGYIGGNGLDGRRWLAAAPHLINEDVTFFCNDDDGYDADHVESIMHKIDLGVDWAYSLRSIHDKDGFYLFNDRCEALGDLHKPWNLMDNDNTNFVDWCMWGMKTECLKKIAIVLGQNKWGVDREFYAVAKQLFPNFCSTKEHTFNFRLGGNELSVTKEFFDVGHQFMKDKYGAIMPWEK